MTRRMGFSHSLYFTGIVACSLLVPTLSFCQENKDVIPSGTTGETLEVLTTDTVPTKWRDRRWRLFNGRYSTSKFGGGFLYEFAGYHQDANSKTQTALIGTALKPTFDVRDFRVVGSGQLKTRRTILWKAGFMYDGNTKSWWVRETGLMISTPELWGNFFIGRTKEGFSMNKVMNGYAGWTMERQMALDVIPILADGIKWLGYLPKPRIFWNAGAFADWLSEGQSFSTFSWQYVVRAGWLPIYSPEKKTVLHIGMSYRYAEPLNGSIRLKSRPEANPAPVFVDTGTFPADRSNSIGGEAYFTSGPWMFGSEVYAHHFNSPTTNNPSFVGGDVMASYIITGESRPYNTATAIYGFVPVNRPVFKGGPGAWEVLIRYSSLDLNGGTIQGGKFWRITPMVNWYLSKALRLEVAYGYGVLDRFGMTGATQFFQSRIQYTIL
jgi:phosphate-selective porin OprO and OprP